MTRQARQVESAGQRAAHRWVRGALAGLLALLPSLARAEERPPAPGAAPPDHRAFASVPVTGAITLGTSERAAEAMLGRPRSRSTIYCLGRSMFTYEDGTTIVFVDGHAISAVPGGAAVGAPGQGHGSTTPTRLVFFDPAVLRGTPVDGPVGETKRLVEECFIYAPQVPPVFVPPRPPPPLPPPCPEPVPGKRIRLF
jgi:hypothetical protein